jgi:nucleotide-binding universal stress UspA family protein
MDILSSSALVTNPLLITPLGVIIAVVFLGSIVGILGWMLRLPQETERTRAVTRAIRSVKQQARILVPLLGTGESNDRLVAMAMQMAHYRHGEVEFLVVMEVPWTLPLDARVEQEEREALEKLEQAGMVVSERSRNGARVRKRLLKTRSTGVALVHEAEEQAVDLILIANRPGVVRGSSRQIDPAVEYLLKNAPCEVLVFSQPRPRTSYERTMEEEVGKKPTLTEK